MIGVYYTDIILKQFQTIHNIFNLFPRKKLQFILEISKSID